MKLPWDELADRQMNLIEAERGGDIEEILEATELLENAKNRMGLVAAVVFGAAAGTFGNGSDWVLPATWNTVRQKLGIHLFDHLFRESEEASKIALRLAQRVGEENRALRQKVIELERRLDSLTPGIGDPKFASRKGV